MAERSLLLLKPDVIHRSLIGTIIARIEARNFKIVALKMFDLKRETLDEHYAHIVSKPFYPEIVSYMTMGPVVGIIVEGKMLLLVCANFVEQQIQVKPRCEHFELIIQMISVQILSMLLIA